MQDTTSLLDECVWLWVFFFFINIMSVQLALAQLPRPSPGEKRCLGPIRRPADGR